MTCIHGACHWNPNDPMAPEYGKVWKGENNSRPGCCFSKCVQEPREPRTIRNKKTRDDYK
jgi:hypothetical protein